MLDLYSYSRLLLTSLVMVLGWKWCSMVAIDEIVNALTQSVGTPRNVLSNELGVFLKKCLRQKYLFVQSLRFKSFLPPSFILGLSTAAAARCGRSLGCTLLTLVVCSTRARHFLSSVLALFAPPIRC